MHLQRRLLVAESKRMANEEIYEKNIEQQEKNV